METYYCGKTALFVGDTRIELDVNVCENFQIFLRWY